LLRHAGRIVPKKQLLREVWGYHPSVLTRTIDTHLAELRRKLENDAMNTAMTTDDPIHSRQSCS